MARVFLVARSRPTVSPCTKESNTFTTMEIAEERDNAVNTAIVQEPFETAASGLRAEKGAAI